MCGLQEDATNRECEVPINNPDGTLRSASIGSNSNLFCRDGAPLVFYVPQCKERSRLLELIECCGGAVISHLGYPQVLHLLPHGWDPADLGGATPVVAGFVEACVYSCQLLPVEHFTLEIPAPVRRPPPSKPRGRGRERQQWKLLQTEDVPSDGEERQEMGAKAVPVGDGRKKRRLFYTAAEDEALVRWVQQHPQSGDQGTTMWSLAERAKLTRHSRASMQNRWRRYLRCRYVRSEAAEPQNNPVRKRTGGQHSGECPTGCGAPATMSGQGVVVISALPECSHSDAACSLSASSGVAPNRDAECSVHLSRQDQVVVHDAQSHTDCAQQLCVHSGEVENRTDACAEEAHFTEISVAKLLEAAPQWLREYHISVDINPDDV